MISTPLAIAEVRRHLRMPIRLAKVSDEEFDTLLRLAYEAGSDAMQAAEGLDGTVDLAHLALDLPEQADLLESDDDAPIIRLINALLTQAVKENASDIHIEPFENRLVIRFRVDGVLREVLQSRRAVAPLVVSRIKVMSKLDIAERRLPQDGRISLRIAGRAVDVRVSTIPSGHGERVVLRLLDKQAGRLDLAQLGMDDTTSQRIDQLIHRPHGILLVTGPTGSGKTTTLYAALTRLADMGIEPFLLASSLLGVLAQRLVRVLDPATREAYAPTEAECAAFGKPFDPSLRFYRPGPEAHGRNAGYKGRTGLYELIVIDETLRRMIHEGASEAMLIAHARKSSPAMLEDGWNKVIAGITSADEVLRVTRDE